MQERALTPQEELALEQNIAWIFGARRSGTTWLGEQLLSYQTSYIHEPTIIDHLAVAARDLTTRRIDFRKDIRSYFFSEAYRNTWQYYLGRLILYRIYAQVGSISKKVIVKEPSSELDASDIISSCLPNSKVIILFRDGRDIIDSLLDARQEEGWLIKNPSKQIAGDNKRLNFIERRAKIWVKQMEVLLKTADTHPEKSRFVLRYEDLRKDSLPIASRLYEFLGITISQNELQGLVDKYSFEKIPEEEKGHGKFYRSASPGKWKENFTKKEAELMHSVMGPMLQKLGYQIE